MEDGNTVSHASPQHHAAGLPSELGAMQQQLDQALHAAQAWQAVSNQLQALVCQRVAGVDTQ